MMYLHNQMLYSQFAREKQEAAKKEHEIDVRISFSMIAMEVNNREFYEKLQVIETR